MYFALSSNALVIKSFYDKQNMFVRAISNGLNQKTTFEYEPITDIEHNHYTETTTSFSFPVSKFRQPLYVVTAMNYTAGNQSSNNSFFYKNAHIHRDGKGFMGFEEIRSENYDQDREITTQYGYNSTYYHIYPVKQTVKTATTGSLILQTNFQNSYYTTGVSKVIFPYVSSQTTVDGLTGITKTINYLYSSSDHGNPYKITETQGSLVSETNYTWEAKNSPYKNRITQQVATRKGIGTTFTETKKFAYDAKARLTEKIDFYGHAKAVTTVYGNYDNFGNPRTVTTTAANCPTVTGSSVYDATGRFATSLTDALGNISTARYDAATGVLLENTDIAGLKTTCQYDGFQRLIQKDTPVDKINYSMNWETSGKSFKTTVNSLISGAQTAWYSIAGLEIKRQIQGFSGVVVSEKEYNTKGQLYRSYLPDYGGKSLQYVEYAYDDYGRVTEEINLGRTTTYEYTGLTTTVTAPNGTKRSSTFNSSGLVANTKDEANNQVTYTYNSLGKPVTITSVGATTNITYDDRGFQQTLKDVNMGNPVQYVYNAYGQLTLQTNARGQTTSFQYDAAGRITQETAPERTLTYQYVVSGNGIGQIQTIKQDNNIVCSYGYTPLGLPSSVTEKIDNIDYATSYIYDVHGQMIEKQSPSGMRVSYQYNNGWLTSMHNEENNSLLWQANAINALGQITESMLGNGLKRIIGYDSYHFLNQILLKDGATVLDQINYNFNATTSNLTSRSGTSDANETFGYDDLNRLISISPLGMATKNITYYPNGNINTKFDVGTYQYANNDHAVSSIINSEFLNDPPDISITNTSYNRVHSLTQQGVVAIKKLDFQYNPNNQRNKTLYYENNVLKKTMYYVGSYEKEVIAGGSTKEYDYICTPEGLSVIAIKTNGTRSLYYVNTDHLGSIRVVTTATKDIQNRNSYDAWGRRFCDSGKITDRGFAGHEHLPEFELINMNARLYDPLLGRFLEMDPYVQMPDYTQSHNRYAYCMNNPLIYTDPDGEFWHLIIGAVIGGVVNWATHGCKFTWKGLGYFGVGAAAGALGAGVGAGISSVIAGGSFGAGFVGSSAAMTASTSFISGAAIGAGAGASSGFTTGFGNALLDGKNFGQALGQGGIYGLIGGASGAVIGGLWGGIDAVIDGRRFWDGATVQRTVLAEQNIPIVGQVGDNNCLPANVEAVDRSFGGNMTQQDIRNLPGLGGDPNTVQLYDTNTWSAYSDASGHQVLGDLNKTTSLPRVLSNMQSGNRVSINLNTSNGGHSVVMQSVVQKTVTKVNGTITQKLLYYVMNPANGGGITRIGGNSIINSYNIFYILP